MKKESRIINRLSQTNIYISTGSVQGTIRFFLSSPIRPCVPRKSEHILCIVFLADTKNVRCLDPNWRSRVFVACLATTYVRGGRKKEEKKKIDPFGRGGTAQAARMCAENRHAIADARSLVSRTSLCESGRYRRYKTDLVDWYQPVQRPDAATALVARVRERRSRVRRAVLSSSNRRVFHVTTRNLLYVHTHETVTGHIPRSSVFSFARDLRKRHSEVRVHSNVRMQFGLNLKEWEGTQNSELRSLEIIFENTSSRFLVFTSKRERVIRETPIASHGIPVRTINRSYFVLRGWPRVSFLCD